MSQYHTEDIAKKETLTLKDGITHLVTVTFNKNHFCVLYYSIHDHSFTIYDGLSMNLNKWTNVAVHLLKKYGIVGMEE